MRRLEELVEALGAAVREFSVEDAKRIGDDLGVDWGEVDVEEFRMGLGVETEHDQGDNVDVVKTDADLGRIALAHLRERPDYYTALKAHVEPEEGRMGRTVWNADQPRAQ